MNIGWLPQKVTLGSSYVNLPGRLTSSKYLHTLAISMYIRSHVFVYLGRLKGRHIYYIDIYTI